MSDEEESGEYYSDSSDFFSDSDSDQDSELDSVSEKQPEPPSEQPVILNTQPEEVPLESSFANDLSSSSSSSSPSSSSSDSEGELAPPPSVEPSASFSLTPSQSTSCAITDAPSSPSALFSTSFPDEEGRLTPSLSAELSLTLDPPPSTPHSEAVALDSPLALPLTPGGSAQKSPRPGSWLGSSLPAPKPVTSRPRASTRAAASRSTPKHRKGRRIAKHRSGLRDGDSSSAASTPRARDRDTTPRERESSSGAITRKSRRSSKKSQALPESPSTESLDRSSEKTISQSPAPSSDVSRSSEEPGGRSGRSESFSTEDHNQSLSPPAPRGTQRHPLLKRKSSSLTSMAIAREVILADIRAGALDPKPGSFSPQPLKSASSVSAMPHIGAKTSLSNPVISGHISSASLLATRGSKEAHSKLQLEPVYMELLFSLGKEQIVAPGAIIIKQQCANKYLFFILRGKIVETCQWAKSEKIVSTLSASDIFGLVTCALGIPSETNFISAEAHTSVLAVLWDSILKEAEANPAFSHAIFRALSMLQADELKTIPFEVVCAFQRLSMISTQMSPAAGENAALIPGHTLTERVMLQYRVQIRGKALLKRSCFLYFTENHLVVASKENDSYPYVIDISEIRASQKEGGKIKFTVHNSYASPNEPADRIVVLYMRPSDADELMKRLSIRESERNPMLHRKDESKLSLSRQDTDLIWHNAAEVRYRHGDPILPKPINATDAHHVWLYYIIKGRLSLRHRENGVTVGIVSPGETFGEVPFLIGDEVFTGVTDSLDLTVKRIDSQKVREVLANQDPLAGRFYLHITRLLSARHREFMLKRIDALLGSDIQWFTFPRPDTLAIIEQVDADARSIRNGATPEFNRLYMACEAGQLSLVQAILSRKIPPQMLNGSNDRNAWTCLHAALAEGHLDIAETLLRVVGIDVRLSNKDENLPIHFLARQKLNENANINSLQLKVLDMMLQKGSTIYSRNRSGEYPIHLAAWKGNHVLVRAFLKHQMHPNIPNKRGETALHYSAVIGDVECARILIESGIDKWITNDGHQTALDFAQGGSKQSFIALFEDNSLDQDDILRELRSATYSGKIEQVAALLTEHTDARAGTSHPLGLLNTPINQEGFTLPLLAAARGHISILHMFFNSNDHQLDAGTLDKDGNTILHLLCRVSPKGSFETATYTNILKRLNERCSFVPNNHGELPLHVAVLHHTDLAINYWLHLSYPLAYKTSKGLSVIDYAVIAGNLTVANHLAQSPQPKNLSTFALELAHRTNQEDIFAPWLRPKPAPSLINRWANSSAEGSESPLPAHSIAGSSSAVDDGDLHLERFDRDPRKEFQVLHQIGQGACGAVLKARHKASGDLVAIKQIKANAQVQANLKNEIDILEGCQHENIVQYRGCFFMGGNEIWLVMQFCGVGALSSLLKTIPEPLSEPEISSILGGMLSGLGYLHKMKLVHRDLKPQNVLVDDSGEVKIADFGVSTQLGGENDAEVGTPLYMSPEVLDGAPYDARSDIWALGVTAIELAEGQPPHATEHMLKVMVLISEGPAPVLQNPNRFSPEFNQFVDLCVRKTPDERASISDLLAHPFIVKYQRERMATLKALVDKFHARKRQKEEEEIKVERQKLLIPDIENFLASLKTRSFDGNPKAFDAALAKLNAFVNDLVELCRFVDEGKQNFVDKQAAENLILQIAASKQALLAKRPSGALDQEASSSDTSLSELRKRNKASDSRTPRKPRALTDREWQDISAKLAEIDSLRNTVQSLTARVASLETTIGTLLQMGALKESNKN